MNREQLAWAAGLFDGEGNTNCSRRGLNSTQVQLSVSQKGVEVLERFREAVGGLGAIRQYPSVNRGVGLYVWNVSSFQNAQAVIAMLWGFLSEPKRQQALTAFRSWHSDPVKRRPRKVR